MPIPKSIIFALAWCAACCCAGNDLKSGEYFVKQTWSQETNYQRPYYVNVPEAANEKQLPVLLLLHGNGGNAKGAMRNFLKRNKRIAASYVTIFPKGYKASWNIVSERSKADDRDFIEAIIAKTAVSDTVDPKEYTLMGISNGGALVNQIAIESNLPQVRNYITCVSQLNTYQHDGKAFKAKGADNNYTEVAQPMTGKRLLNVSGTTDALVPYQGGPSKAIPAKDGKLAFVNAETSAFLWAKAFGYTGAKVAKPSRTIGKIEIFDYLNGRVVHHKVVGAGHGATGALTEDLLLEFLDAK